jgi:hypothetical protein
MKTHDEHALFQLLNAFLEALPDAFERRRRDTVWTPPLAAFALLLLTLQSDNRGYDSLLATLRMARADILQATSCPSGFCRARQKLTEAVLKPCWDALRACMGDLFDDIHPMVHGYRLVAIDGVWINARRSHKLFKQLRKSKRGRPVKIPKGQPQMLVVAIVDVLTRTPIAWECLAPGEGERAAAKRLAKHLGSQDILLADRGFPARDLLQQLTNNGTKFIIRMTSGASAFSEVHTFCETNGKDRKVIIRLGKGRQAPTTSARLLRGHPQASSKKSKRPKDWILLTNLPRNKKWKKGVILDLYRERWGIETFFRELKQILGADYFHAHSLEGMKAEITMAMLAGTLVAAAEMIALTVTHQRMPAWNEIHQRRCNRVTLKTIILTIILKDPRTVDIKELLDHELGIAGRRAQKRRPGRTYPRICKSFYGKWRIGFRKKYA